MYQLYKMVDLILILYCFHSLLTDRQKGLLQSMVDKYS